jgi:ferredoxin-nitrite reductase
MEAAVTLPTEHVFLSPENVHERDDIVVVDVRDETTYRSMGHVPGAVNIPATAIRDPSSVTSGHLPSPADFASLLSDAGIASDDSLVVYDGDRGVEAARFLLTAAAFGHEGDLRLLEGGFDAWRQQGSVETGSPDLDPTTYEAAAIDGDLVYDRVAVEDAVDGHALLVDTRTPAEYEQSHIPGAVQLSWEELLEEGRLRPAEELEAILAEKGIERGRRIVLYCNTARRLSHTFLVLADLGFENLSFYEGSLTDWVRAESPDWNPQQLYEDVRELAPGGVDAIEAELGEDVFSRTHLIGLYTQKQDEHFMLRTKVPCGYLTAEQARTFGEIAEEFTTAPPEHGGSEQNPEFGDGFLDITTRQGLQLHWIRVEDMPEIWDRYAACGLTTIQASGNTLRNVVTCPASGLGDDDRDVGPLGEAIADRFEGDRELANLPRKLKVSLSGCTDNCARAEIQDLGFVPARKDGREGYHVRVGGGLSDGPRAATDLGVFLEPDQTQDVAVATADLFIDHGSYLDTAVNRLRFLVEEWGTEKFREELQRYLDFEFEPAGEDLTTDYRGDHVGVHEQGDGRYYVGINVPTGRMAGQDLVRLADLSEKFGSGELRTTINQNLVLPDVAEADLKDLLADPVFDRYSPDPGPFERGIVTCTGAEFCGYGVVETKTRGLRWARELDQWLAESDLDAGAFPDAVRVHMSGCSASCAQPQVGDFGLRGERHRDETGEVPAADVGAGSDLAAREFIDWVAGSVPLAEVPDAIKRTLRTYQRERAPGESFADWASDQSLGALRRTIERDDGAVAVGSEVS